MTDDRLVEGFRRNDLFVVDPPTVWGPELLLVNMGLDVTVEAVWLTEAHF